MAGTWKQLSGEELKTFQKEIFDLIRKSYMYIGGHPDFQSPDDINENEANFWKYIDIDSDEEPDAITAAKTTSFGKKSVLAATDGTPEAKKALIQDKISELNSPGNYAEVSGRIAEILLQIGVPIIDNEEEVKKVLIDKQIQWLDNGGWYVRKIGGIDRTKIMIGKPNV